MEEGLGREDMQLRRDLGMKDIAIRQDQLDLLRTQHTDDVSLRRSALALEEGRAEFERYAFDQQFGMDERELSLRREELQRRFGLDERQFYLAGGMAQLEQINRQAEMRLQESGNYPRTWVEQQQQAILARLREQGLVEGGQPQGGG
jgi:hypothetical protein